MASTACTKPAYVPSPMSVFFDFSKIDVATSHTCTPTRPHSAISSSAERYNSDVGGGCFAGEAVGAVKPTLHAQPPASVQDSDRSVSPPKSRADAEWKAIPHCEEMQSFGSLLLVVLAAGTCGTCVALRIGGIRLVGRAGRSLLCFRLIDHHRIRIDAGV